MMGFDKKIKKLSKEFKVPDKYYDRVDEVLESIREDSVPAPRRRFSVRVAGIILVFCLFVAGCLYFSGTEVAKANFFETFKQTIMDFFGMDEEESQEIGVDSAKEKAVSKSDLMIELREKVIDSQSIYLMVKITAPTSVEFNENISFDYFGFCEGENYNVSAVLPGVRECKLLEVLKGKKNVATYVTNISTNEPIEAGKEYTAFFKDLTLNPNGDNPQTLVEGMWSVSFTSDYTVSENITVKGTADMVYSFLDTTATVTKVKLLPLGLTLISDVSKVGAEKMNISDTRITVRLKMIDGSEMMVTSPDPEEATLASGGSATEYEKKGKLYSKSVYQFAKSINIDRVLGIYIEDCYVPFKEQD